MMTTNKPYPEPFKKLESEFGLLPQGHSEALHTKEKAILRRQIFFSYRINL